MALPKLTVPEFELELPSTGEKVIYRPFLVKEEKILLMALEGDDEKEMARALKNIINDCTFDKHDISTFAPFDIEYMFLNLRGKSIGESIELAWKCRGPKCTASIPLEIQLDDIKCVKNAKHTRKIEITEDVGMMMKYPNIEDMANINTKEGVSPEEILETVAICVESVYSGDDIDKAKDLDSGELAEWLGALTQAQFSTVQDFFDTMPKMVFSTTKKCKKCEHVNKIRIEGMKNFFG